MIHSSKSFTCGTQLACKAIPSLFHIQPLRGEHPLKEPVGWQWSYGQSFCPLSLVAARFQSSLPRMLFITFPKHRKKLLCVRTASVFTNVKVKIYFQPPFPCPVVSKMTQTPLPTSFSHQRQSLTSSSWRAFQTLQPWRTSKSLQVHTTYIPQFSDGFPEGRHSSAQAGTGLQPMWSLHAEVGCTMPGAHKFFSTWFAVEQTHVNTQVPFEWCSQIYGFCCSQMLPFYFIICTFCVLVFSRRNRLSLIVENCTLLHKDKCWSQPAQYQSQLQARNCGVSIPLLQLPGTA